MIVRTSFILSRLKLSSSISNYDKIINRFAVSCKYISNIRNTPGILGSTKKYDYSVTEGYSKSGRASDDIYLKQMLKEESNNIGRSERFTKIIKLEEELNLNGINNILNYFYQAKDKILRGDNVKEEIKSSKEFSNFLQALQKNVSDLNGENLASCLMFCYWFHLPTDHDLYVISMVDLIDKIDDLPFLTAVSLYHTLKFQDRDDGNELKFELMKILSVKIKNEIIKSSQLNYLTFEYFKQTIKFISISGDEDWPDEILVKLINSALENSSWMKYGYTFGWCLNLIQIIKDENERLSAKVKLFKKIYASMLENNRWNTQLCLFLRIYSFHIYKKKEILDEEFFSHVFDRVKKTDDPKRLLHLLSAVNTVGYIKIDFISWLIMLLERKDSWHEKFPSKSLLLQFYRLSLELLTYVHNTNVISKSKTHRIDFISKNLPILDNVDDWDKSYFKESLFMAVSLASMGVFPENLLNYLSSEINESVLEEDKTNVLNYLALVLNQAVVTLNPESSKSFSLNENLISFAVNKLYSEPEVSEEWKFLMDDIEKTLNSMAADKNNYLFYKFTKIGHSLPVILAVNERNEFFEFSPVNDSPWVEDFLPPENYKLVAIIPFLRKHYSRNECLINGIGKIRLSSLQSMGYRTVPVIYDKWVNLSDKNKKLMLIREGFSRSRSSK